MYHKNLSTIDMPCDVKCRPAVSWCSGMKTVQVYTV